MSSGRVGARDGRAFCRCAAGYADWDFFRDRAETEDCKPSLTGISAQSSSDAAIFCDSLV